MYSSPRLNQLLPSHLRMPLACRPITLKPPPTNRFVPRTYNESTLENLPPSSGNRKLGSQKLFPLSGTGSATLNGTGSDTLTAPRLSVALALTRYCPGFQQHSVKLY